MKPFKEDLACRACGNVGGNTFEFVEKKREKVIENDDGTIITKTIDHSYIRMTCSRCGCAANYEPIYLQ